MIGLLGLPSDEASTYLRGAAQGPKAIRHALVSPSTNMAFEGGGELELGSNLIDLGDLELEDHPAPAAVTRQAIEAAVLAQLDRGRRVVSLGGDHAVTYPILRAYAQRYESLTVLQIDAHPDLWEQLDGVDFPVDRFSHASPFARAMEEGCAARLVQCGVRTINQHQREQAQRFGVEVHAMDGLSVDQLCQQVLPRLESPLYVTLDLDALDPAFAPGVSHHEPGGFTTREVLRLLQALPVPPVGADVVELNSARDRDGVTAMVAAKMVKQIVARMLAT